MATNNKGYISWIPISVNSGQWNVNRRGALCGVTQGGSTGEDWQVLFISLVFSAVEGSTWTKNARAPSQWRQRGELGWGDFDPWKPGAILSLQLCTAHFLTFSGRKQASLLSLWGLFLFARGLIHTHWVKAFKSSVFDPKKPVSWLLWSLLLQTRKTKAR